MTIFRVMFSGEKDLCVCENHLADIFQEIILKKGMVSPAVAIDENPMTLCEWEPQDLPCETEPSKRLQQYVDDRLKGHMDLLRRELAEGRYGQIKAISAVVVSTKDGEVSVPPVSEESPAAKLERLQEGLYQAVKAAADKGLIPESYGILQALDALTAFKLSGEKDE